MTHRAPAHALPPNGPGMTSRSPSRPTRLPRALALAACAAGLASAPPRAAAQGVDVRGEVFAGSEVEEYLRILQVAGRAPLQPWSIRAFSPGEVAARLPAGTDHPWAARYELRADSARRAFHWVRPDLRAVENSGFAYGDNDGAVWAGRGATASVRAGFAARMGPLSLTVAPVAFVAQNSAFPLMVNGSATERGRFADGRVPNGIDAPQRFGAGRYARVDPGQSTLRLDLGPVAVGASTANQVWGPGDRYPLILGTNAAGFPHAFLGTSRPLGIGIGRVHARLVYGRLGQSDWSPAPADSALRFMSGLVAVFVPRGLEGLELGVTRFFHSPWPDRLSDAPFGDPLQAVLKGRLGRSGRDADGNDSANQLASAFARWAFPRSGVEVWGEYAREDHSYDLRDYLLEPDHSGGFTLGGRKVWARADGRLVSLRAEVLDTRPKSPAFRPEGPFYVHSFRRQGHTQLGQVLGSPAAYGGAAATLALDAYGPGGRWSAAWSRQQMGPSRAGARHPDDVQQALSVEAVRFRRGWELTAGAAGVYEMGRYYGGDAFNLNASLGVRVDL
ncbi:MAG: hypothetical protein JWM27_3998 [Gemmatimonadetes bacterium]|nr:hypothetical protein [Gemmatimonadota bacterium]